MTGTLLWLVALAALSLAAAIVLRRMASARRRNAGARAAPGRCWRASTGASPSRRGAARRRSLDEVRRRCRRPGPELRAGGSRPPRTTLRALATEARTLKAPRRPGRPRAQLTWELERAVRAADMAGHGVETMAAPSLEAASSRRRPRSSAARSTCATRARPSAGSRPGWPTLSPADVRADAAASTGHAGDDRRRRPTDEDLAERPGGAPSPESPRM